MRKRASTLLSFADLTCLLFMSVSGCGPTEEEVREKERIRIEKERAALQAKAPANFEMAKASLEQGDLTGAEDFLNQVAQAYPQYPGLEALGAEIQKAKERVEREERERQAAEKAAADKERRAGLEATLRESFLDRGLDIKVRVTGANHDRLKLTYVLFSDVWSHRMQKEGLISEWCGMGFKRIDLTDGYDWAVYWTCS
ncbi:MAG TPA: hypothetical protein VEW48_23380 [Thermoanaerobaculia bacterium]|nr:hypothetical protein [Thermoanaerobaculia bacterium]